MKNRILAAAVLGVVGGFFVAATPARAAEAGLKAGDHVAVIGPDEEHAVLSKGGDIPLRRRIEPHAQIHRRCDENLFVGCEQQSDGRRLFQLHHRAVANGDATVHLREMCCCSGTSAVLFKLSPGFGCCQTCERS